MTTKFKYKNETHICQFAGFVAGGSGERDGLYLCKCGIRWNEKEPWPLNKENTDKRLNSEHKQDCEIMQTGAPICTCGAENRH